MPENVSLLPLLRTLHECYAEVEHVASRHLESLGLTPCRFDILAALGDTEGMTVKELGDRALITKGTLLHVVANLEGQGLLQRKKDTEDTRQTIVSLTPAGQALYESTFLVHVGYIRSFFDRWPLERQRELIALLKELQGLFADWEPKTGKTIVP